MATTRELNSTFENYFQQRVARGNAITPGQKKALIEKIRQELTEQGRVPLPTGPVKLDPEHKVVKAALEGRPVAMNGQVIKKKKNQTISERMQGLPVVGKIAVMIGIVLLPCIIAWMAYYILEPTKPAVAVLPTETATPTPTHTPSPSASPNPSSTPTTTPEALMPSPTTQNTPTPTDFIINNEDIPSRSNDPASIEVAGLSYVLGTGKIKNGAWQPQAAEWLSGSSLRRIIAIPYNPDVANTLTKVPLGTVAKVRLRSGEIVKYKISEFHRVARQQIEILAEKKPSIAIILSGETGIERTIIIGSAIQEPQDFTVYSANSRRQYPMVISPTKEPELNHTPTPVIITNITINNSTAPITNTTQITNSTIITR